jgi:hypothetical protein
VFRINKTINIYFGQPEPIFHLELDAQSQAAYNRWLEADDEGSEEWDEFVTELERQVRPMIGTRGYIEECYG